MQAGTFVTFRDIGQPVGGLKVEFLENIHDLTGDWVAGNQALIACRLIVGLRGRHGTVSCILCPFCGRKVLAQFEFECQIERLAIV
ncbi:MAG: hypothetical protein PsegKO_11290 [Pseudohongiellaceae bacterium]